MEANKKGEEDWFCSKIKSSTLGKIKQNIEGCKFILGSSPTGDQQKSGLVQGIL